MEYHWRVGVLEKKPRHLIVGDGYIREISSTGRDFRIEVSQLKTMRFTYAPTRMKPNRYMFTLIDSSGQKIRIENMSYQGAGGFADQSAAFVQLVKEILLVVFHYRPDMTLHAGAPALSYFAQLTFVSIVFVALAGLLMMVPLGTGSLTSYLKLGIILFFIPVLFSWVIRARPRSYYLSEIPDDLFPKTKN
ncbi:MAG: hypothetical protein ACWA5L_01555 [bacterium]